MEVVGSGQQRVEAAGAGEQNVMEEEHKVGRRSEQAEMKVVGSGQEKVEAVGAGEQNVMEEEHMVGRSSEQVAMEVVGSSHQKVEAMVGDVEQNVAEQQKLGSEQDVLAGDEMQVLPQGEKDKLKADDIPNIFVGSAWVLEIFQELLWSEVDGSRRCLGDHADVIVLSFAQLWMC